MKNSVNMVVVAILVIATVVGVAAVILVVATVVVVVLVLAPWRSQLDSGRSQRDSVQPATCHLASTGLNKEHSARCLSSSSSHCCTNVWFAKSGRNCCNFCTLVCR